MGVMLVIGGVLVVLICLILLLMKFCKPGSKMHSLFLKIKAKLLWNSVLRFILQGYLKFTISTLFALYLLSFSSEIKSVNAAISIIVFLVLLSMPVFFGILLHRNRDSLQTPELKAKIGSAYLGTRTADAYPRLYSSVFLVRRMVYAILTILCISNPNILIHVFLFTNLIYSLYLGLANPHDAPLGRRMEFINEIGLQLITYHLALFPLAPTLDDEELAGWSMIGTIGLVFAVNLVIMLGVTIGGVRRKLYLRKLRKQ